MPRPRVHDDELRAHLVDTAAALLATEGPTALGVRRVAAEAGTSTTAIYSLLGSKEELVRAMYLEGFRRLDERLSAVAVSDDPVADLWASALAYHDAALASPNLYEVMFGRPIPEFCPTPDDAAFALGTFGLLVGFVERWLVGAGGDPASAEPLAQELWAANHGVTSLALAGMLGGPAEARARLAHLLGATLAGYEAELER